MDEKLKLVKKKKKLKNILHKIKSINYPVLQTHNHFLKLKEKSSNYEFLSLIFKFPEQYLVGGIKKYFEKKSLREYSLVIKILYGTCLNYNVQ